MSLSEYQYTILSCPMCRSQYIEEREKNNYLCKKCYYKDHKFKFLKTIINGVKE